MLSSVPGVNVQWALACMLQAWAVGWEALHRIRGESLSLTCTCAEAVPIPRSRE